jgi:hypothetical protein
MFSSLFVFGKAIQWPVDCEQSAIEALEGAVFFRR